MTVGLDEMSTQNERVESHEMTTWRAAPGIQRVVMSALSKGVLEEAESVQKYQRSSRNEHPREHMTFHKASRWDIREQRPDAALDVLGADCTSMGNNKNRLHQT